VSTVTFREAAELLGVHESTIERRVRITGVPVENRNNRRHVDPETLADAWAGHLVAAEAERSGTERVTDAALNVPLTVRQRQAIEEIAERDGVSKAAAARRLIDLGWQAYVETA
jgi:DNA-binding MurR/RpiR family transcriptional regulator